MMYWVNNVEYPTNAVAKWGARTILKNGVVDILRDRVDWDVANDDVGRELGSWLQKKGLKWLDKEAKHIRGNENLLHFLDDGKFHIRCNAQASYGYLYVAAWMDKEDA